MYAVFEDVLRQELFAFVAAWNVHRIRLQKDRPHVVHGQPWMNYHYPDPEKACNWGIPIDRSVLSEVARPLANINISSSLEPKTKCWCSAAFTEMGCDEVLAGAHPDLDKLRPSSALFLAFAEGSLTTLKAAGSRC